MSLGRPLIARHRELRLLEECLAWARSGHATIAFIRGESGIGKSRLAESLVEQARGSDVFVAVGHCTPVTGGELPFGPFVEMLSQIGAAPGSPEAAGTTWDLLRTVMTVSGAPGGGSPDVGLERSRLFTSVLWALRAIAERQSVMLVFEDLHWADSSSLDLLNFLARTAGQERLLLVLTCRDDAIAGDSNAARGIRDLTRAKLSHDVQLKPMSPEEIRQLLAASDVQLPVDQYDTVVDLSDGNPFIALELASRDGVDGAHSQALRHALMNPIDELPGEARLALRVAAVLGQYIPHEVLEQAIESTGADVTASLRLLTERGLLIPGPERYHFRHAIVRESVVREMLHGEQLAAHRAAVQGIRLSGKDRSPAGLTQLAHHLVASRDYTAALPVVISAARQARAMYAFPEARRQFGVAREVLWSRVDDPQGLSGYSYEGLVSREAEMTRWAGRPSEAAELVRHAIVRTASGGLDRARLELELGEALWAAGDPVGALAAWERSEDSMGTAPEDPALRARVVAARARGLVVTGRHDEGRAAAERALELAEECGVDRVALQARITLATAIARQGEPDAGVALLRLCLKEALAADAFQAVVRCYGNLAFLYATTARLADVLATATEGAEICRRFGPLLLVAPTMVENWVHALVATGRWDEAQKVADELEQEWAAEGIALALHLELAQVAAARGALASFEEHLAIIEGFADVDDPYTLHDITAARAEYLLWQGAAAEAHRTIRESLVQLTQQQDATPVVSMCSLALRAHADLVTARADRRLNDSAARETADLLAMARDAAERDTGALGTAYLLLCEAEAARASLTQAAEPWTEVVTTWQRLDMPFPAAYAQWRQAEQLFGARARAQATRALASALATATRLGCAPLEASLRTLARHAGVSQIELEGTASEGTAPVPDREPDQASLVVPLTPRELDVLTILTQGFSNQQIARRLFISESTVSVHVSHIIAKLGVSNRLQAAAAAERLKLVPHHSQQEYNSRNELRRREN